MIRNTMADGKLEKGVGEAEKMRMCLRDNKIIKYRERDSVYSCANTLRIIILLLAVSNKL
jgi:hypothetical protein